MRKPLKIKTHTLSLLLLMLNFSCTQSTFNAQEKTYQRSDEKEIDKSEDNTGNYDEYGTDGNGKDGNGKDGYGTNGNGTNGNGTDGYGTDGYGTDGNGTDGNGTDGNGTDVAGNGDGTITGSTSIAKRGKSLDLYFVMDVSGSLLNNDPYCQRFSGVNEFRKSLRNTLGESADVRTSWVFFNDEVETLPTTNDFLKLSDRAFTETYRSKICKRYGGTNPGAAFDRAISTLSENNGKTRKDMQSVLFFTDGLPTQELYLLERRTRNIGIIFQKRIFSVILGGGTPEALDFLRSVSGEKIKQVGDSARIGDAINSFLK